MAIIVRTHATERRSHNIRFEGIREVTLEGPRQDGPVLPRLLRSEVECQKGGMCRSGSTCLRCPRLVNVRPMGDRLVVRCLWTECDRVADVMTLSRALITVTSMQSVTSARAIARKAGLHHLLVVDGEVLSGVVCGCDLDPIAEHWVTVADRMSPCPWVVDADAPLAVAAELMHRRNIRCLPVVCGREVCGVITHGDLRRVGLGPATLEVASG